MVCGLSDEPLFATLPPSLYSSFLFVSSSSFAMSWQGKLLSTIILVISHLTALNPVYVDDHLVATKKVAKAAILGQQGGIWAATPGFTVCTLCSDLNQ